MPVGLLDTERVVHVLSGCVGGALNRSAEGDQLLCFVQQRKRAPGVAGLLAVEKYFPEESRRNEEDEYTPVIKHSIRGHQAVQSHSRT